ncbi:hypothetical protein ACRALDRAFT_1079941 [Sodiomyces alcalophilus JCM 7366]|uniref:uncharacterized protein n=1 Tax=Sodiomyces alcalophilus JCM 7366 TaxID=591952 RepID=UPI0039B3ACAB
MARVASRRQVQPAVKPATTNTISRYARLSKAQVSSPDGTGKKVLAVCLPNSKAYEAVTVTAIYDSSDEENNYASARPSVAVPEKADTLAKDRTPNKKKRKAPTGDDDTTSPRTPSASKSLKRQRIKRGVVNDEVPLAVAPSTKTTTAKSVPSHHTQLTLAETYRRSHKSTLISNAKKDGRDSVRKAGRPKEAKPHASSKSPAGRETTKPRLPAELLELLDLQKAILKTVVLQIAHRNENTPIDISDITPQVSRTWGKRKVTMDDIRTCIAIQDMKPAESDPETAAAAGSPFIVTDYGRGKLCLEIDTSRNSGAIDEDALCRQFEKNLHILCAERVTDDMSDLDLSFENLSFDDLPKADITPRHHLFTGKQNPLLAKGHRALADMKSGIAMKQQEKETKANAAKASTAPDGKKMSLLDRIRAKEVARSQIELPSGPELARKRAIMRACDVAAIIGMLASSSNPMGLPVLSFTMAALQQKIKDSLRVPVPVEEGIDTVKVLANDVAPEWLRVVSMGGREHVVIQTRRKPYDAEIAARVSRLPC